MAETTGTTPNETDEQDAIDFHTERLSGVFVLMAAILTVAPLPIGFRKWPIALMVMAMAYLIAYYGAIEKRGDGS